LTLINNETLTISETIGAVSTMGILCGVYGINVAHDLGHRSEKWKQKAAQLLLLSSMYMHFFIEHNRGHHKRVGTLEDPATARKGETIYAFWYRCIRDSFISAFKLEKDRLERNGLPWLSIGNQFIKFIIIELVLVFIIVYVFSLYTLLLFLVSAAIGILLLESINYVEHYALFRDKLETGVYERVNETHSWNSDHILGRYLLFELTRHSHHHENSLTKYQDLESMDKSLQLPTGYPGMIILALIPSLFFKTMNKRLN
ncbi:MAG: alkane 1-monooxygenase, partial [Bacteroidia bacterium]|nr:alkane 1-monooxygenase [Bacteroidia bacterium]